MLPFLYQTRTLASLCGVGRMPVSQYKHINAIRKRNFGRCAIRSFPDEEKSTTPGATDQSQQESVSTIRKIAQTYSSTPEKFSFSYRSSNGPKFPQDIDDYADRDARDSYGIEEADGGVSQDTTHELNSKTLRGSQAGELEIPWGKEDSIEFEEFRASESPEEVDSIYQETDEIKNLTRRSDPREDRASTITPSERLAFQKIFSDIFARSQPITPYSMDGLLDEESMESSRELKTRTAEARASLDRIVHHAAQSRAREEIEAAVNRYPPALRPAAARAMGLTSQKPRRARVIAEAKTASKDKAAANVSETSFDDDNLERLRKPERDRVEGLMRSASTDFELWTVMQKEVFTLISKLGLEETPAHETAPKKKRAKKSNSDLENQPKGNSQQRQVVLHSPVDEVSPLEFYGPLYPSYLLLGLRLLDRSFARPSPLTLTILPTIKSFGIISHVLGGSTQLYNELLLIHWYRHDDFRGVLDLLNEMEQFGLSWDEETWDIIDHITKMQKAVRDGDRGVALKALFTLPEFASGRFKPWRNKIGQTLVEENTDNASRLSY